MPPLSKSHIQYFHPPPSAPPATICAKNGTVDPTYSELGMESLYSNDLNASPLEQWDGFVNDSYFTASFLTKTCTGTDDESLENFITLQPTVQTKQLPLSTPFNKHLTFIGDSNSSDWHTKPLHQWTTSDTIDWVIHTEKENELDGEDAFNFKNVDGSQLLNMTEADFVLREPNCGRKLFQDVQNRRLGLVNTTQLTTLDIPRRPMIGLEGYNEIQNLPVSELTQPEPKKSPVQSGKRPGPGRPKKERLDGSGRRKNKDKKTGRLWEFIRDLLLKPEYCPSLICWEDHDQGIFRFVHSEKVARLWGSRKENPKMTYEKLSRAMRYYYRSQVLLPVLGRRLVYKFGPTATGWRTSNPNFKNKGSPRLDFGDI